MIGAAGENFSFRLQRASFSSVWRHSGSESGRRSPLRTRVRKYRPSQISCPRGVGGTPLPSLHTGGPSITSEPPICGREPLCCGSHFSNIIWFPCFWRFWPTLGAHDGLESISKQQGRQIRLRNGRETNEKRFCERDVGQMIWLL